MPRRKEKVYHYIYKTTCNVNEKFYIGIHSTDNLDDGYLGSGKRLKYSVNKYGEKSHTKEILEFLPDRGSLKDKEKKLVNEELLNDPMCMNLQEGGGGGFVDKNHMMKCSLAGAKKGGIMGSKKTSWLYKNDPKWRETFLNSVSGGLKGKDFGWGGRKHSEETKEKMRNADRAGSKNSQYGTCWITNDIENKKIHKGDLIPEGWRPGRKIK